jgi:uncharacterized protein YciI
MKDTVENQIRMARSIRNGEAFHETTVGSPRKDLHGHGATAEQIERRANPMFIVVLNFSHNKGRAGQFMEGHKEWLKRGFDDGVFLLAGSLQPNRGGGIVAHNTSLPDLQSRVNDDPFVVENVVTAEILEITPSRADARLQFLLN